MSRKRKREEGLETRNGKRIKVTSETKPDVKYDPHFSFLSLPPEIFSHHILKFFDFRDWLKLVVVCKQWQASAKQSPLQKQFYFDSASDSTPVLKIVRSILVKYRVDTLVINFSHDSDPCTMTDLFALLNSAPSLTTLVMIDLLCSSYYEDKICKLRCNHIKVLSVPRLSSPMLAFFPKVTKLKVASFSECDVLHPCLSNVKELEMNIFAKHEFNHLRVAVKLLPSLEKVYVNYKFHGDRREVEEDWRELEEIGESLGVQVICRNPHLSKWDDVFNLTSLSYHEYFNSFGETPLQTFLELGDPLQQFWAPNNADFSKTLFRKYTSKQYEKDLFHREPQFRFPSRSYEFSAHAKRADIHALSKDTLSAMVECQYIDRWKALCNSVMCPDKETALNALQQAKYLPSSYNIMKAISYIVHRFDDIRTKDVRKILCRAVFKQLAHTRSKHGETALHCFARAMSYQKITYKTIAKYCDIHAVNDRGENAATVAYNCHNLPFWLRLVQRGIRIQHELYTNHNAYLLVHLFELLERECEEEHGRLATQGFTLFDQPSLQWLLRGFAVCMFFIHSRTALKVFEELVRCGADVNDHDTGDPILTAIAQLDRVRQYWKVLKKCNVDLNKPNKEGYTPLMISIQNGFYLQAKFLLKKGADPNAIGTSHRGEIRRAAFLENTAKNISSVVDSLVEYGADFSIEDENGNTVLNYALSKFDYVDINALVKLVQVNKPNRDNFTPLSYAIAHQFPVHMVRTLIESGADVNARTGLLMQPPLHLAIEKNDESLAYELLITGKVDIRLKDNANRSFVHHLLMNEDANFIVRLLNHECTGEGALLNLIHIYGQSQEVINFVKEELTTIFSVPELLPLKTNFLRIALTDLLVAQIIIEVLGVDINTEDSNGDTMLTLMDADAPKDLLSYLLWPVNGAHVNHQNKQKNTALMCVTLKKKLNPKNKHVQAKLIDAGASMTIKNMWGISPLDTDVTLMS